MLIVYAEERPCKGRHLTKCKEHGVVYLPLGTTRNAVQTSAMPESVRRTAIQSWTVRRLRIIELVVGVDVDARGCYFDGVDSLPVHLELLANASSPVQRLVVKEHV